MSVNLACVLLPLFPLPYAQTPTGGAQPDGGQAGAQRNVVQVYDLAGALPRTASFHADESLLPYLGLASRSSQEEQDPLGGADVIIDGLRSLCGDEFDYEGRSLQVASDGRLYVWAPPALQERTARYLAFLEGTFSAASELWVDILALPAAGANEAPLVMVPVADVGSYLGAADKAGSRKSYRLRLRSGETGHVDSTRATDLITDYDVEIAQSAYVHDPIARSVAVGTQLFARAAGAPGGTWLAVLLRHGEQLGEVRTRDIRLEGFMNTTDKVSQLPAAGALQSIDVLQRSLALNLFLPDGFALLVHSDVALQGANAREVIVLRSVGKLPASQRLDLSPKGSAQPKGELLLASLPTTWPPRVQVLGTLLSGGPLSPNWRQQLYDDEEFLRAQFADDSYDLLYDLLRGNDQRVQLDQLGPWLFVHEQRFSAPLEGQSPLDLGEALKVLERSAVAPRPMQALVTLRRGSTLVARAALPLRAGAECAAVLGVESIEVQDCDVEVAQSSASPDPISTISFDGLVLWLEPNLSSGGDLTLQIKARAHVRRGPRTEFELRSPAVGSLEEGVFDQLLASERWTFAKGEKAPRRMALGDSGGGSALALEIEVAELR
jgi:hypothetical protein